MKDESIGRRDFLKRSSCAGLAVAATCGAGFWLKSRSERPGRESSSAQSKDYRIQLAAEWPRMTVVSGGEPAALAAAALAALGGMQRFVSRGDVVVLKPNIGWDRVPQQAANTNPDLVKAVAQMCMDAGAKRVVVTDVSCNDPRRCFTRSGIKAAVESIGATVLLPEERKFRDHKIQGELLSVWPIYTPILDADKVINMPIVKHHNLSRVTMGMKNWYGILGGRRNQLHQNIDLGIADLATFMRPTLTIMDAYRVLMANGPQGGNLNDVKLLRTVVAGVDPIAIDAYGATFLGLRAEQIPYIMIGHERGLGNRNYAELQVKYVNLE
jgi:uncharacterized protein (DUF362 family)